MRENAVVRERREVVFTNSPARVVRDKLLLKFCGRDKIQCDTDRMRGSLDI